MIKLKEQKKSLIIFSAVIAIVTIVGVTFNTLKKNDLYQNSEYTKGSVIDFHFNNNSYIIKYSYIVDGTIYTNEESIDYFKCPDGTPGCKGKEFTVRYSTKNPKNSEIDLGRFNDKKPIKPSL